jgi:hypothetical protein
MVIFLLRELDSVRLKQTKLRFMIPQTFPAGLECRRAGTLLRSAFAIIQRSR